MLIFWIMMNVIQTLKPATRSEFFIQFPSIVGAIRNEDPEKAGILSGQLQAHLADTDKARARILAVHWARNTLGTDGERVLHELCYKLTRMQFNFDEYQTSAAANALMEVIGRTTLEYDRQIVKTDYSDYLPTRLIATLNENGGGRDQQSHPVYAFFHESMGHLSKEPLAL